MGLSSSKSRTSSKSSSSATSTPSLPSYLQGPATSIYGQIGNLASSGYRGFQNPATGNQIAAFNGATNLGALNTALGEAIGNTRGLINYTPQNVSAGQLATTDLSPYMNPYTQGVIDTSLNDLERGRQTAISNTQGQATAAGAFGGSRHGVADSLTNREFADSAGSLAANLRNAGWNTAMGAAQFDIGNRMNADQFNSQQGLAGANFRLGAANQLGSQGMAQDANTRANLGTQADLGAQERAINEESDPQQAYLRFLAQLQALYGINPNALIQQNQTGQQQSSGTTTSSPSGISQIGTALQIGAGLFPSDRRLKREIVPVGEDERGNRWYEFEYIWDAPGVKSFGVMADEVPAHAVHRQPNGFDYVDYGAI